MKAEENGFTWPLPPGKEYVITEMKMIGGDEYHVVTKKLSIPDRIRLYGETKGYSEYLQASAEVVELTNGRIGGTRHEKRMSMAQYDDVEIPLTLDKLGIPRLKEINPEKVVTSIGPISDGDVFTFARDKLPWYKRYTLGDYFVVAMIIFITGLMCILIGPKY